MNNSKKYQLTGFLQLLGKNLDQPEAKASGPKTNKFQC